MQFEYPLPITLGTLGTLLIMRPFDKSVIGRF